MTSALPADFDADFYVDVYEDVRSDGLPADEHYINHGRQEHRYFSRRQLERDIRTVRRGGDFDADYFSERAGVVKGDPIRQYLLYGPAPPNEHFDAEFFLNYYASTLSEDENAYAFYCAHRLKDWCVPNSRVAAEGASLVRASKMFNADFYRRRYLAGRAGLDPAMHYLVEGFRSFNDPSGMLHGRSFALSHPDLAASEINPLVHWVRSGKAEARVVVGTDALSLQAGGRPFRPDRDTLLIVSHEASRTGAPIVVLSLLRHLAERFNVVVLSLSGGSLLEEFRRNAVALLDLKGAVTQTSAAVAHIVDSWSPKAVVLNTIVSAFEIRAFVAAGLPIVTLIHDFAVYVRPIELILPALTLSDAAVFPADIVRDSALAVAAKVGVEAPLTNLVILPQGRSLLPPSPGALRGVPEIDLLRAKRAAGFRLIVGAGFVQPRKGLDLFIETARQLRAKDDAVHFIWVGAGYDPRRDAQLSVYLEDQVKKSGLSEHFTWVAETADLFALLAICQVFFLSSRLDPFPNVALDAAAEGLPVVCFQNATGIADLAERFPGLFVSVPFQDCAAAADALRAADIDTVGEAVRTEFASWSDFQRYADSVGNLVDAVARKREQTRHDRVDQELDAPTFQRSAPSWLREGVWGVAPTVSALSEVARRLERNGFDGARLRAGRPTGKREGAGYRRVRLAPGDAAGMRLPCLAVVRSVLDVERIATALFDTPSHGPVATFIVAENPAKRTIIVDAVQSLRAGVLLGEGVRLADLLSAPLHVWLTSGDRSLSADMRNWDRAAAAAFDAPDGAEVLLVEKDVGSPGAPSREDQNKDEAGRIAGLSALLIDPHHLWIGKACVDPVERWLAGLSANPTALVLQSLLDLLGVSGAAAGVIDRQPARLLRYGEILYGRDFNSQLDGPVVSGDRA